jgi:hypothetical protein
MDTTHKDATAGEREVSRLAGCCFVDGRIQASRSDARIVTVDPASQAQDFWWFPYASAESLGGGKR